MALSRDDNIPECPSLQGQETNVKKNQGIVSRACGVVPIDARETDHWRAGSAMCRIDWLSLTFTQIGSAEPLLLRYHGYNALTAI
jgi:hypothetical protein